MGMLCDIFVSTPEMALRYESMLEEEKPRDDFVVAEWKGLTSLEFGTLWALIESKEFDPQRHGLEALSGQGESWLYRFPSDLVNSLASLDSERLQAVSAAWAATEELQWPTEDAEEVLESLAKLAKLALKTGRGLFHWGCL